MNGKVRKILLQISIWIKCHIFNKHLYIKNNYGLDEGLDYVKNNYGLGEELDVGYVNWDNDVIGDIYNYYDCQYCESFNITSHGQIDKEVINRILHLKRRYKLSLEKRVVLVEKCLF